MESLKELGEFGVIRILEEKLGTSPLAAVGFGDDIAAVSLDRGRVLVLKADMLVGSTDVPPGMTMYQAARKSVVANVSDMAAKGVRPLAGLVSLGLPASLTKSDIVHMAIGLRDSAKEYGFPLVGGDTNESNDLTISIALFGVANRKRLILRSGARVGDVVAVTGEFGSTAAGLSALLRDKRPSHLAHQLLQAVYNPQAQLETGLSLAASGAITASIDSSDGLAWSLHELARASKVAMRIDHVPIDEDTVKYAAQYGHEAMDFALYGGEEYHLVITVNPSRVERAKRAAGGRLRLIGTVTRGPPRVYFQRARSEIRIERRGWEHFKHRGR